MRVLYLSPRESWPANSGAKLRDFHLARGLAERAEVKYLFFGGQAAARALSGQVGSAVAVPPPQKYTANKIVRGLLGSRPLPILNYTSPQMMAAVEAEVRETPFDIVHLDSIHMVEAVGIVRARLPKAIITLDWHNIESEAMERFAAQTSSAMRRRYAAFTAARLRRIEDEMLRALDGHLVCSERESDLLQTRNAQARVAVVENGVDAAAFVNGEHTPRPRLVFVGQMAYGPNAEGAVWFVESIWPALRQRRPDLELVIVGADPGPAVQALAAQAGVTVTGTVPDVRPFYEGALAAVVPLRSGAGTRLKILEAMAAGTPVISTALGAEGLQVTDGVHLLLAEEAAEWVRALDLVSEPVRASTLTAAARKLVAQRYDWKILGGKLADLYQRWAGC